MVLHFLMTPVPSPPLLKALDCLKQILPMYDKKCGEESLENNHIDVKV